MAELLTPYIDKEDFKMKNKRISRCVPFFLAAALLAAMLAGCGGGNKTLDGTYTATFSSDEITSNTFHNGFVTALGANEVNTITFTSDGNYTYTKELHTEADGAVVAPSPEGMALLVKYAFTGTYTVDGGNAILNFPAKCDFSEDWGPLAAQGMFINTSGTYAWENGAGSGDIVQCKEDESHVPMDLFTGPYVLDNLTTSESGFNADNCKVTVTLDDSAKTFTYVIVNTDDE